MNAPHEHSHRRYRWFLAVLIALALLFAVPVWLFWGLLPHWQRVQVLESADRQHVATLERLYGGFDTNFRVKLDGKEIHWSWDCRPTETIPFRETLAWDESGSVLVFELANEIVFAYDLPSHSEVDPMEFHSLKIPAITLDDIGFEGRDELRSRQQGTESLTP